MSKLSLVDQPGVRTVRQMKKVCVNDQRLRPGTNTDWVCSIQFDALIDQLTDGVNKTSLYN